MTERVNLTTGRLQMRPFRPGDVADVSEYANDEEFSRFLPMVPFPYTIDHAEQFVSQCVSASWDENPHLAIVIEGRVAGSVELRIDREHATAEIGYALARPHWGEGYMTEAVGAVIAWAFGSFGIEKIWATADVANVASTRVMEKLGMAIEGTLRGHHRSREEGVRVDVAQYGLLRSEWRPTGSAPDA